MAPRPARPCRPEIPSSRRRPCPPGAGRGEIGHPRAELLPPLLRRGGKTQIGRRLTPINADIKHWQGNEGSWSTHSWSYLRSSSVHWRLDSPANGLALLPAFGFQPFLARPVARELPRHAPAARAALQRPLQGGALRRFRACARRLEVLEPHGDDLEIVALVEGIERRPQPEALGERYLLLRRLARMDLFAHVLVLEVLLHVLRHQVVAVGGGVDHAVLGSGRDRAVEHHLQRLESRLVGVE